MGIAERLCLIIPAKELICTPIFALRVGCEGERRKKLRKSRRAGSVRALASAGTQFIDADESAARTCRRR